ncbi:hypothetical protein [Bacteroides sp.]|uniref:hypothetical protein n=1 Tax=Bacteroides sp. TaxID=29523 RepID=UPI002636EA81|nr:hypothetical protein [Bacteroides sp.]
MQAYNNNSGGTFHKDMPPELYNAVSYFLFLVLFISPIISFFTSFSKASISFRSLSSTASFSSSYSPSISFR